MQLNEFKSWLSAKFNGLTITRIFEDAGIADGATGPAGADGADGADGEDGAFPPLTELPATATLAASDLIYVLTDVGGTPTAKAITFENLVIAVTAAQGA